MERKFKGAKIGVDKDISINSELTLRGDYARMLISKMDLDINSEVNRQLKKQMHTEFNGRIVNVILRGYDIPLQGSTTHTCNHLNRVLPDPIFFKRKGYFKSF